MYFYLIVIIFFNSTKIISKTEDKNDCSRCGTNEEIFKFLIIKHCCSTGCNFNFRKAKIIFKPNRISEIDFLENITIHLNREINVNEKIDSIMLSATWKNLFSTNNHCSLNSDN